MVLNKLLKRSIGPPLLEIPAIMQATAQTPIKPILTPTTETAIFDISLVASFEMPLALVARSARVFVLMVSLLVLKFA
jgi:hypothetical protein